MRRTTSPTLLREKLGLISQILLFGSVGTASSAVVYFLQDQFRQIRRLKCMFDNGRKFAEMARQHGVPESTIQRLYENNTNDPLLHLESHSQIRFETIVDDPKLKSSPNGREWYHFSPISPPSKKRKRGLDSNNNPSATIGISQDISNRSNEQTTTVFLRNGYAQWLGSPPNTDTFTETIRSGERPFRIQKRAFSTASTFREGIHIRPFPWSRPSLGNRQRPATFRLGTVVGKLRRSIAVTAVSSPQNDPIPVQVPDRLEKLCTQILLKHKISLKRVQYKEDACQPPSVTLQTFLHFMASLDLRDRDFKQHLPLLKELIIENRLNMSFVLSTLDTHGSNALLLLLYQDLHQRTPLTPDLYRLSLEAAIEATKSEKTPLSLIVETISDAPKHLNFEEFISTLGRLTLTSVRTQVIVSTLKKLIAAEYQEGSAFLKKLLPHLKHHWTGSDFESFCFEALNFSNSLSDEKLTFFSEVLLRNSSPNSSLVSLPLFTLAYRYRLFTAMVTIYQHHPDILDGTTVDILREAYSALSPSLQCHVDLKMLLRVISLESPSQLSAETIHLVQTYYSTSAINLRHRIFFLQGVFHSFDGQICSDILLSLPKQVELKARLAYIGLQRRLISQLWESTRNADDVHMLYIKIRQWHITNSEEVPFEIDSTMLFISGKGGAEFKHSLEYAQNLAAHPTAHLDWESSIQIMSTLGVNNAWEEVERMLERMHAGSAMPSSLAQREMISAVLRKRNDGRDAKDALHFARNCIAKYGLLLGPNTYDSILSSAILTQNPQDCLNTIKQLFEVSAGLDEDIGVRRSTIYQALKAFATAYPNSGRFLFQFFIRVWSFDERLISGELCEFVIQRLAVDARTMEVCYWRRRPIYRGTTDYGRRYKTRMRSEVFHALVRAKFKKRVNLVKSAAAHVKWLSEKESSKTHLIRSIPFPRIVYNSKDLAKCLTEMEQALTYGLPRLAIEKFEIFSAQNPPSLGRCLELAVRACLKLDDISKAEQVLSEASARGYNTSRTEIPLLCHRLRSRNLDAVDIQDMVIKWYESGKAKSSGQAHAILVSAVTTLLEREESDPTTAINLLLRVHSQEAWTAQYPFHIAVYNTFLAAYSRTNHLLGMVWAVHAILEKNLNLTPDFFLCLWQSFRRMWRALQTKGQDRRARIASIAYYELFRICRARRLQQERDCFDFGRSLTQMMLYDAPHPGTEVAPQWEGSLDQLKQKQHDIERERREHLRNLHDAGLQDRAAAVGTPFARGAVEEMESDTQDAMRALERIAFRTDRG